MYHTELNRLIVQLLSKYDYSDANVSLHVSVNAPIYTLMKNAYLPDEKHDMEWLEQIYLQYCEDTDPTFSLQELLDNHWITHEFGEWTAIVSYMPVDALVDITDDKLRDVLSFLRELQKVQYEHLRPAVVNSPNKVLNALSKILPGTPDIHWIVEKRILTEDDGVYAFSEGWQNTRAISHAAAQLWMFDVNHESDKEKLAWLDKICACNATPQILNYMDDESRAVLLGWFVEIATKEPWIGNVERAKKILENYAIADIYYNLSDKNYNQINCLSLYPKDLIEWLHHLEMFEYKDRRYHSGNMRKDYLILRSIFTYFHGVPTSSKDEAASILFQLLKMGYFSGSDISNAESLIAFTQHEHTQFLSIYIALANYRSSRMSEDDALSVFGSLFDYILEGRIWRQVPCAANFEQVSLILRHIVSYCSFFYDEGEQRHIPELGIERLCKKILNLFSGKLKKNYWRVQSVVLQTVHDLGAGLETYNAANTARHVASLICIAQTLYQSDAPLPQDDVYKNILSYLKKVCLLVFDANTNYSDIYISSAFWCNPIWLDVYKTASAEEQEIFCTPIPLSVIKKISTDISAKAFGRHRKKAIIQTSILSSAAIAAKIKPFAADDALINVLSNALYRCLINYQHTNSFDIFKPSWLDLLKSRATIKQAGSYISATDNGWITFSKTFESMPWQRLLIWLDFVANDTVAREITTALKKAHQTNPTAIDHFERNIIVDIILRKKLTSLYPCAIESLKKEIEFTQQYEDPIMAERKTLAQSWLSEIYYRQDRKDLIRQGDDNYYKAILLIDEGNIKDALLTCNILVNKPQSPRDYLLRLYCSILLIVKAKEELDRESFRFYIKQSNSIVNEVENDVMDWNEEARYQFAEYMITLYGIENGENTRYVWQIAARYKIPLPRLLAHMQQNNINAPVTQLPNPNNQNQSEDLPASADSKLNNEFIDENMDFIVNRQMTYGFVRKAKIFVEHKGGKYVNAEEIKYTPSHSEAQEIVLLKCVLDTLQSIHDYSVQLQKKAETLPLYERRINELFRVIFDRAYGNNLSFGITCHDERPQGPTGAATDKGRGVSPMDFAFMEDGNFLTVGEAILLEKKLKKNLQKHMNELIGKGNDSRVLALFNIIFYAGKNYADFKQWCVNYICNSFRMIENTLIEDCMHTQHFNDTNLFNPDIFPNIENTPTLCTQLKYCDGRDARIYHIIFDIRKYSQENLASESRK